MTPSPFHDTRLQVALVFFSIVQIIVRLQTFVSREVALLAHLERFGKTRSALKLDAPIARTFPSRISSSTAQVFHRAGVLCHPYATGTDRCNRLQSPQRVLADFRM